MRLAVLAEQNFNLVDGSTIWLLNLCRMLAALPSVETTLILKEALSSRVLADDLPANIALVEPTEIGSQSRLTPDEISSALENFEGKFGRFDRIIVRGDAFLSSLLANEGWAGRVIAYSPSAKPRLDASAPGWIADAIGSRAPLLTQSPISKAIFETFHDYPAALVEVLPPVVHGLPVPPPGPATGPLLVYSGKIDPGYGLEWLCDLIDMPELDRGFAITVLAGKTIARAQPLAVARFEALAEAPSPGVSVHRNLPHSAALSEMARARFGFCLRSSDYDGNVEISTKVLEFCALGVVPILNDTALNRDLLGADYPFLFDVALPNIASRVAQRLSGATEQEMATARARISVIAEMASSRSAASILAKVLGEASPQAEPAKPVALRVASHDNKFLLRFLDRAAHDPRLTLRRETWRGIGEAGNVLEQTSSGETIFCEWCGENAVWHSHNKPKGARLIVRLHRFEAYRDFPGRVNWPAVDRLIVVSQHFKKLMIEAHGIPPDRIDVLPQYVDCEGLRRKKRPGARFRIGYVGLVPFGHKRLDRAVDILEALRAKDPRFTLIVRGAMPWKMRWAWDDSPNDRRAYEQVFDRIFSDPNLSEAIRFDPPGADMEEWFREVGFVLSTSSSEGCHTAIMEGMASGAMPIVRRWPGAADLFGDFVHEEAEDAIPLALAHATEAGWEGRCESFSARARGWDVEVFNRKMMELIA